jgi:23S rRNA pseudouridine2605 synthase
MKFQKKIETKPVPKKIVRSKSQSKPPKKETELRLNKFIAESGVASRRKADELIAQGIVKVNGISVFELGTKVSIDDKITINGDPISIQTRMVYILLNKPKDYITTTSDEKDRKTVMDLVRIHSRIYPVGRLDRNSTGVLLMTNDGELSYRLTHPKYEIKKVYNVYLDKALQPVDAKQIAHGVELEDGITAPCELMIDAKDSHKVTMVLQEGRNREIRRLFEHFEYFVRKLDRKYFATLSTTGLGRGEFRHLGFKEIRELKDLVGMD